MAFAESELLPISALQHLLFCERQCALIHTEQLWAENRLTAEGRVLHEKAHDAGAETRVSVRAVRGLHVRSLEYGVSGIADVIEFHAPEGTRARELSRQDFWNSHDSLRNWEVFPIEYKRGKQKKERYDEVQLCAQTLCLEEMLNISIDRGALFYGLEKRRMDVAFDDQIRNATIEACRRLREVLMGEITPPAVYLPHCSQCSLVELCLPTVTEGETSAHQYFAGAIHNNLLNPGPSED